MRFPTTMPRALRWLLISVGGLVAVLVLALLVLLNLDWNRARPWLGARASAALGRPVELAGPLSLQWARGVPVPQTWSDYLPWPQLTARQVRIGNPPELGQSGNTAVFGSIGFSLQPLALLRRELVLPELRLDSPHIDLLRLADGRHNWRFTPTPSASPWQLRLERVLISKGELHLNDAQNALRLDVQLDTRAADARYGIQWSARGQFGKAAISGDGKTGALLALRDATLPFPVAADVRIGSTHVVAEGSLTRPAELAALDLRLAVAGASMARLYELIHVVLPETPPFSTSGRLRARFEPAGPVFQYEQFKGKVGASDIAGNLSYRSATPRGQLSGTVSAQLLRLSDLAPLIGADDNARKAERETDARQPAGKLLPVEPFRVERWTSVDADVQFSAERILREQGTPITRLNTHVLLKDGVLQLDPLQLGLAGGTLQASVKLDSNQASGLRAEARLAARHVRLRQLFPKLEAPVGEINADAHLRGQGSSVAGLLGTASGEWQAVVGQGQISQLLLEEMGLNIGNVVLTKLFGDKPVQIHCAVADVQVSNGLMQTRRVGVDTETALIDVSGKANLATEQLDLVIRPQSKGLRVFSLRSPLYARGSFTKPDVGLDKGMLALRAGSALALTAVAPVAALLPLVATGPDQRSSCAALMQEAQRR
ncbi:AsmA family protein [Massilia sp. TS11]|uniref:AsmA family protein n=1 Tax=Massilia sp. TS11 TaxID=2908003 RepID=UPI001EDAD449|nr:AsmA family protein [Massilia sp. TS11]MCG2584448.1 AsmA family protein [Massilia sp. TS11]